MLADQYSTAALALPSTAGNQYTEIQQWQSSWPNQAQTQAAGNEESERQWGLPELSRGEVLLGRGLLMIYIAFCGTIIVYHLLHWPTPDAPIAAPWDYVLAAVEAGWGVATLAAITNSVELRLPYGAWRSWPFVVGVLTFYSTGLVALYVPISDLLPSHMMPSLPPLPPLLDAVAGLVDTMIIGLVGLVASLLIPPLRRHLERRMGLAE
jgi:hypothetical protein